MPLSETACFHFIFKLEESILMNDESTSSPKDASLGLYLLPV